MKTHYYEREKSKKRCRHLRREGESLDNIVRTVGLPKTTIYGYIKNIALTKEQKLYIERRRRMLLRKPSPKKGKCRSGKEIMKPSTWSDQLINVVAHFKFDGYIGPDSCVYYNRCRGQIENLKSEVHKLFGIEPKVQIRHDGVRVISYYNVELADYIKKKAHDIFPYLENGATKEEKRVFPRAFFDDEGNIYFRRNTRRVRGYQKSIDTLKKIKNMINEFGIYGRIYPKICAIEITGKGQLEKFAKEIGFSPGIALNPFRKNTIWKKAIEKREMLDLALSSYVT